MNNIKYCKVKELAETIKGLQVDTKTNFSVLKSASDLTKNNKNYNRIKLLNYKMIKMLAIEKDMKHLEHIQCVEQDLSKKYKDYSIQNEDIVIPVFPNKEQLDIVYIDNVEADKCVYSDSNLIIRVSINEIKAEYLYIVLNSKSIKDKILKLSSNNSRQARITATMLENLDIPIIDIKQQEEIIKTYNNAINQVRQVKSSIEEMLKGGMPYGAK